MKPLSTICAVACLMFGATSVQAEVITAAVRIGGASDGHGGAMASADGSGVDLVGCILMGNSPGSTGGAMDNCSLAGPVLINCLLSKNDASVSGEAMSNRDNSFCVLQNCTIGDNVARAGAGAFLGEDGCRTELTNCIVWGNTCPGSEEARGQVRGGESPWKSCCVQPDLGACVGTDSTTQDPLFVAGPLGDYYLAQVAAGQAETSPCCDAGAELPMGTDLAKRTTRTDSVRDSGRVDIGYQYPASSRLAHLASAFDCRRTGRRTIIKAIPLLSVMSAVLVALLLGSASLPGSAPSGREVRPTGPGIPTEEPESVRELLKVAWVRSRPTDAQKSQDANIREWLPARARE